MYNLIIYYLLSINLISFTLMKVDKEKSKKHKWRISEKTFIILTLILGGPGILLGKKIFHHKTKKFKFTVIIPSILILQLLLIMLKR